MDRRGRRQVRHDRRRRGSHHRGGPRSAPCVGLRDEDRPAQFTPTLLTTLLPTALSTLRAAVASCRHLPRSTERQLSPTASGTLHWHRHAISAGVDASGRPAGRGTRRSSPPCAWSCSTIVAPMPSLPRRRRSIGVAGRASAVAGNNSRTRCAGGFQDRAEASLTRCRRRACAWLQAGYLMWCSAGLTRLPCSVSNSAIGSRERHLRQPASSNCARGSGSPESLSLLCQLDAQNYGHTQRIDCY